MQITEKAWLEYITKMSQISQKAADLMQAYVQKHGFADDKALLDYAFALSQRYGQAIGALSCKMYEATASAQRVVVPTAEIADLPEYGEVAKAVHGTMKQSQTNVPATIARLVKQVGADTTLKNAMRDGAQFAWVPHGDTCAFCITLASRGWQYMSKKALRNGHAEHIHAHCDCEYAVRFDGKSTVAGYDPDKYLEEYQAAGGDINAMRRIRYKENKDAINARKRMLYAMKQRDFMGAPKNFTDKNKIISIKAYQVKGHDTIFTQTNTKEAQDTIALISSKSDEIQQLQTVSEIVVARDIPGIASYDHVDNRLYINERISNADYIEKQLASGYFVAENAEDILRHEMHHKDHWDYIKSRTLTSGKSSDIVKQEIEADLREYVKRQLSSDPAYIRKAVSKNAETGFKYGNSLNELIADSLLQDDKEKVIDSMLVELVQRCIK